ncbi:MAG: hypothetical protein IJS60_09235 [Abditibacteriota bacterium]|nr:hypothetical protein [Abditibacteriota bacterium]
MGFLELFTKQVGNVTVLDWIILLGCIIALRLFSYSTKKYMRSVADFLSANRLAGRYLLTISSAMGGIGVVSIVGGFEAIDQAGIAPGWWGNLMVPMSIIITISGWVYYRFRETRCLTMAQFFEKRYSRKFRIFAGIACWLSGIINFGIFPAVAARFLIFYTGLPERFHLIPGCEFTLSTFLVVMAIDLFLALSFVNMGGQISVMITDCIQGMFSAVAFLIISFFLYFKFGWHNIETAMAIPYEPGKNRINPFDAFKAENFNIWFYLIQMFTGFYGYYAWQGSQGFYSSAKTPHEAKMGAIIGGWRAVPQTMCIGLMSYATLCIFRLPEYAHIADAINAQRDTVTNVIVKGQMQLPLAMAMILPLGLKGLLCTIMVFISFTCHDTYMHSWGAIFIQDVYMPMFKKKFRPHEHINVLRKSIAFVACFAYVFSALYPQNQPILMFFAVTGAIWLGGAGSVIIGGLYTRWGHTAGAYGAMITGAVLGLIGVFIAPIWKGFLILTQNTLPALYAKYVTIEAGEMVVEAFPINGQYINMITMTCSILVFILLSVCVKSKPYNLDKLLHRGKYAINDEHSSIIHKDAKIGFWQKIVGITPEFSKGDRVWAYIFVFWSLHSFVLFIVFSAIELIRRAMGLPFMSDHVWFIIMFWGIYLNLAISIPVTVWFTVGGIHDIRHLYRDLSIARRNDRDDGSVEEDEDEIAETVEVLEKAEKA